MAHAVITLQCKQSKVQMRSQSKHGLGYTCLVDGAGFLQPRAAHATPDALTA